MVLDTPLTVNPELYTKLSFDPERDLVPISIIAGFSQMLVVHPSVRANTLADFVTLAKSSSLTYGSGGARGNPGHLAMELLRMRTGIDLVHVTYKGNPQVVADLIGGHIQAGFLATPGVIEFVGEGKLRGLAVSSSSRAPRAPDVPTVAEGGYPGFDIGFYQVVLAPAGIPMSLRARIEQEVQRVVSVADFVAKLRAQDLEPIASNGTQAAVSLKSARERWSSVIKAANIHPE